MTSYTLFGQAAEAVSSSGAGNAGTNGLHFTVSEACTLDGLRVLVGEGMAEMSPGMGTYVKSVG